MKRFYHILAVFTVLLALSMLMMSPPKAHASDMLVTLDEVENAISELLAFEAGADATHVINLRVKRQGDSNYYALEDAFPDQKPEHVNLKSVELNNVGRFSVYADVLSAGNMQEKLMLVGQFNMLHEVPVAANSMQRGHVLQESDIAYELLGDRYIRHGYVGDVDLIVGKELTRSLSKGKPFTSKVTMTPFAFKRGDIVTITYQNSVVKISTIAEAMDNAKIGEIVALKNVDSGRIIRAMAGKDGVAYVNHAQQQQTQSGDEYALR